MSLTVEGTGVGTTLYYQHTDHLSGQGATSNNVGQLVELLDYYPYGGMRLDNKYAGYTEQRKYAGHEFDTDTGLSYMEARYYNAGMGKFISQDPMFWKIDKVALFDPQLQNSYSYARNNPIAYNDPDGERAWNTVKSFILGTGDAVISNFKSDNNGRNDNSTAYKVGNIVGNAGVLVVGSLETAAGIVTTVAGVTGGIATSPTGVGAVVGAGVSAVGVAMTAQGTVIAKNASKNLMQNAKGSGKPPTSGELSQKKYLKGAKDKGYIDYIKNIYRKEAEIGSGSTADYFREYGDTAHRVTLEARIKQGEKLLKSGRLTPQEEANVRYNNQDMRNALSGN